MAFIYSLNDPITNTPKYIGCTINSVEHRYKGHLREKSGHKNKKGAWISSLKNQGLKPIPETIDEVPDIDIYFWEMYYISLYKSWGFELKNGTDGGANEDLLDRSFAKKPILQYSMDGHFIREWRGTVDAARHYNVHPNHINIAMVPNGHKSALGYIWRRKREGDYKIRIKAVNLNPKKKKILQYDLEGNFIKEWDGIKEASLFYNVSNSTMDCACRDKWNCAGYVWRFKVGENIPLFVTPRKAKTALDSMITKTVLQYSLSGEFIKEWKLASDIEKELGLSAHYIRQCCRKNKNGFGFKWKYK